MRMSVKGPVPMNEREHLTDKRLEEELRGLPELDPPAHLVSRVMERVEALEGESASDLASDPEPGVLPERVPAPGRAGVRRIPLWQPAAAIVAFAAGIVFVTIRHAAASVELLRNAASFVANAVHFASDSSIAVIAGVSGWFAKGAVVASVFGRVLRTVVTAVMTDYGPFIVVAAVVALGLQLALLALAGRRPEVS